MWQETPWARIIPFSLASARTAIAPAFFWGQSALVMQCREHDVDAVGAHLLAEAIEVGAHLGLVARTGLGHDHDLVPIHGGERLTHVGMAPVLVGHVPEVTPLSTPVRSRSATPWKPRPRI